VVIIVWGALGDQGHFDDMPPMLLRTAFPPWRPFRAVYQGLQIPLAIAGSAPHHHWGTCFYSPPCRWQAPAGLVSLVLQALRHFSPYLLAGVAGDAFHWLICSAAIVPVDCC
jgi:hypothetical protein